jgi:hypothetical protein
MSALRETILPGTADYPPIPVTALQGGPMRNFRKFGSALVFAGFIACAMMTLGTTLHAAGPGAGSVPQYCGILQVAIEKATDLGFADLAAYLQAIYDANCK